MQIKQLLIALVFIWNMGTSLAQNQTISPSEIANVNIDNLSDEQIASYWKRAQEEGYNIGDIELVGAAQGMSSVQIAKLKTRINNLPLKDSEKKDNSTEKERTFASDDSNPFGLTGKENKNTKKESDVFGYDFFNNPNISFEPSLNLATPRNYQLGPGDELTIDVYGAAENSYTQEITTEGYIRVPNIGPITVSGLTLDQARTKIKGSLRKIYNGIGASESSPYKVFTDVSISNIRRVQVNIIGEVEVPGSYSLSALSTVLNALYASGGPSENGTFRDILLVRDGTGNSKF